MFRRSFFALLSSLAIATPAAAQVAPSATSDATPNTFNLRDGSIVQARVVDLRPGQFVVVATLDGTQRTIAWVDIVHAEGPSFPGGYTTTFYAATSSGTGTITPEMYSEPAPDRVQLVIESAGPPQRIGELMNRPAPGGGGVAIYHTGAGGTGYWSGGGGGGYMPYIPVGRTLCTTPCTLYVPRDFTFSVTGDGPGLHPSAVHIPVHSTPMRVRLYAVTKARYWGGLGLVAGGGLAMVAGIGLIGYGAIIAANPYSSSYPPTPPRTDGPTFEVVGGVLLGVGVGALVTGVVFMLRHTGIESTQPLSTTPAPQVTIGPLADGAAGSLTWRF